MFQLCDNRTAYLNIKVSNYFPIDTMSLGTFTKSGDSAFFENYMKVSNYFNIQGYKHCLSPFHQIPCLKFGAPSTTSKFSK